MYAFASPVRRRSVGARRRARRWPRLAAVLLALLSAGVVAPSYAAAAVGTLDVVVETPGGRVTGTGIDCPGDCADSEAWPDDRIPPQKTLTAAPSSGFRTEWHGCQVVAGRPNQCTATFDELGTVVTVRFVDVQAPAIAFVAPSYADGAVLGPNSSGPLYAVEAGDNAGVSRVEFRDAGTLYETVTAPPWQSTRRRLGIRVDGPYVFRATAYDAAGNEASVERTVNYDGTPPVVTVEGSDYRHTRGTSTTVDWSATDLHGAALSHAECSYRRQPEPVKRIPCGWSMTVAHEAEGIWDLQLLAVDGAANRADTWVTIVVDRTAPAAPAIVEGPPEDHVAGTRNAYVRLTPPAGEPDGTLTWNCTSNGRAIPCGAGAGGTRWTEPPGTTAVHFRATVTDRAGNVSPAAERRWRIDEHPPVAAFTQGPEEGAVVPAGDVTLAWSVPPDHHPRSRCSWHDEDSTPCAQHRVTRRVTPGAYRLRVIVSDERDLETTIVRSFTVVAAPDPGPDPGHPDPGDPGPGGPGDPAPGGGSGPGGPGPGGDPGGGSGGGGLPVPLPGAPPSPPLPGHGGTPDGGRSTAKRCTVPKVKPGSAVVAARRRVAKAGCRARVKRVRSARVKRGRVVALSPKAGVRRAAGATVTIRVSRGRR